MIVRGRSGSALLGAAVLLAASCSTTDGPVEPAGPTPLVATVTPDTLQVEARTRLIVTGEGFDEETLIHWDGHEFDADFVSSRRVEVSLPAWSVLEPGTFTMSASLPGGARSNVVEVVVVDRGPQVRELTPAWATVGSGPLTLSVTGTYLDSTSAVLWNGVRKSTELVDYRTLRVELDAADLAVVGSGRVALTKNGTAPSIEVGFPIVPVNPSVTDLRTVPLLASRLAYDPVRGVIYATIPPSAATYANELVALDTATGAVLWSVPVGNDPRQVVVTEDGSFAYVSLWGDYAIARVDLEEQSKVLHIPTPLYERSSSSSPTRALDIAPLPGSPNTIAVALSEICCSPTRAGVALIDDDVARPVRGPGISVEAGAGPEKVWIHNGSYGGGSVAALRIEADGFRLEGTVSGLPTGSWADIVYDSGWLYSAGEGLLIDPEHLVVLRSFLAGPLRADVANGRVHVFGGSELHTLHFLDLVEIGALTIPEAHGASEFVRFGKDGLAFATTTQIVLVRSDLIG